MHAYTYMHSHSYTSIHTLRIYIRVVFINGNDNINGKFENNENSNKKH